MVLLFCYAGWQLDVADRTVLAARKKGFGCGNNKKEVAARQLGYFFSEQFLSCLKPLAAVAPFSQWGEISLLLTHRALAEGRPPNGHC